METRPYFIVGDLIATCVSGWLAARMVSHWIPWEGSMMLAMVGGMVLGMLTGMAISFVFIPFFGAMEVMLPVMLAGKLAGMLAGMGLAMDWLDPPGVGAVGIVSGLLAFLWTTLIHWRIGGIHGP
ncbi:MAG: hypothetical protein HQL84_09890 [Magnetococcales bacterium]|nr:hypothetical protein [Magnetococcales bacterium]MBF0150342.1 hypothetical protein [Magnetococcales bacterium]MBF0173586.1 hypothetical protein [Magnetococcales bacterium]MBF0349271.1 hypothetical protein [Magnetococcales bacterium]MBF0629459.1 hypothetical protein [Magnetococcales bacterium]